MKGVMSGRVPLESSGVARATSHHQLAPTSLAIRDHQAEVRPSSAREFPSSQASTACWIPAASGAKTTTSPSTTHQGRPRSANSGPSSSACICARGRRWARIPR